MTHAEPKELKTQLHELLDKDFIRPSFLTVVRTGIICEEERRDNEAMHIPQTK